MDSAAKAGRVAAHAGKTLLIDAARARSARQVLDLQITRIFNPASAGFFVRPPSLVYNATMQACIFDMRKSCLAGCGDSDYAFSATALHGDLS
jgi:hypothetical protein